MLELFRELNTLINNEIPEQDLDNFSVIIGSNPSQGARSPLLWNKVYKEEKNNTLMLPLDISDDRLPDLITFLQENKKYGKILHNLEKLTVNLIIKFIFFS